MTNLNKQDAKRSAKCAGGNLEQSLDKRVSTVAVGGTNIIGTNMLQDAKIEDATVISKDFRKCPRERACQNSL